MTSDRTKVTNGYTNFARQNFDMCSDYSFSTFLWFQHPPTYHTSYINTQPDLCTGNCKGAKSQKDLDSTPESERPWFYWKLYHLPVLFLWPLPGLPVSVSWFKFSDLSFLTSCPKALGPRKFHNSVLFSFKKYSTMHNDTFSGVWNRTH